MKNISKILVSSAFFLIVNFTFCQNPFIENQVWSLSQRIEGPFEELVLKPILTQEEEWYAYERIEFSSDSTFRAYNRPGCGLDCVVSKYGSYSISENTISLQVDSTFRFKNCHGDSLHGFELRKYHWIQDEFELRIVKSLADEPASNYFKESFRSPKRFKSEDANDLIRRYIYLYNRMYKAVENDQKQKINYLTRELSAWRQKSRVFASANKSEENEKYLAYHIELVKRITELQKIE